MIDYFNEIDNNFPDFKFQLGNQINFLTVSDRTPLFAYDYLIIDPEYKYSFIQKEFIKEEYELYFKRLKEYSQTKINNLMNECNRKDNFCINEKLNSKIYNILRKASKKYIHWKPEMSPSVGHFHLYDKFDCPENRCPVIHFFVGPVGTFYILCFDPFHDIHPTKNK